MSYGINSYSVGRHFFLQISIAYLTLIRHLSNAGYGLVPEAATESVYTAVRPEATLSTSRSKALRCALSATLIEAGSG